MDAELIGRAQHGDEEAFASLAVAAGGRLHAVAHRILRDTDLAEDATQQALLTIWRDLPSSATGRALTPGRTGSSCAPAMPRPAGPGDGRRTSTSCPIEPSDAEGLSSVVDRDQLERGFRRLSIDHRVVVVLHHYLDMPLDRIAETLGVPVGTVRSRLHHAMRGLRAALEADARPTLREVAR